MKTFTLSGDQNRIYFQNLSRRPAEQELVEVLKILSAAGCEVGAKKMAGTDDEYEVSKGKLRFTVIFTGEEAVIYTAAGKDVPEIEKIFE